MKRLTNSKIRKFLKHYFWNNIKKAKFDNKKIEENKNYLKQLKNIKINIEEK